MKKYVRKNFDNNSTKENKKSSYRKPKKEYDQFLNCHVDIVVYPGEDIEKAIKRFSKAVKKSGILEEVRERRFFEKPSDKKRRKLKEAKFRQKHGITKSEKNFF